MFNLKRFNALPFKQELLGICLLGFGLFLGVSLFSYSSQDVSWFYYRSTPQPIHNLGGALGAQIAALFFYLAGSSCILLVGLLIWIGTLLLLARSLEGEWDRLYAGMSLIVLCSLLAHGYQIDFFSTSVPGGWLGMTLHKYFTAVCGSVGVMILLHTLLLISLIILLRFSFISLMQKAARAISLLLCNKRIGQFLYSFLSKIIHSVIAPFIWLVKVAQELYDNSIVGKDTYSVVDFERALIESADTVDAHDKIWHETSQDIVQKQETTSQEFHAATIKVESQSQQRKDESQSIRKRTESQGSEQYQLPEKKLFVGCDTAQQDAKLTKELEARARTLEEKLERFGVYGTVKSIKRGPVVTLFEYEPHIDTKVSKILALEDDLALALQAMSIRIIAPIPGKAVVGFEVANKQRKDVLFANMVHSKEFESSNYALPLILGEDTIGAISIVDLVKMPHLLVAGSTGSGKSVALNAMLISLLCKCKPDTLKLILIDPKRLEFASYADIPHLVFPIITDPKKAAPVLRWVVKQMEERYEIMARCGARTISDYNALVGKNDQAKHSMPYIVVIIDELADLMMTAGRDIEDLIARIAQMARAAGIHMIVATQRPSVDVITGLIKVNFPSRISFRVTSKVDSRTILDCGGADKLLGRGDMLFLDAGSSVLRRAHGAYVSDKEIYDIVAYIRSQGKPTYLDLNQMVAANPSDGDSQEDSQLFTDVLSYLNEIDEISISLLQRRFRIGFNRSARIIERLESQGRIMNADGGKTRKVIR